MVLRGVRDQVGGRGERPGWILISLAPLVNVAGMAPVPVVVGDRHGYPLMRLSEDDDTIDVIQDITSHLGILSNSLGPGKKVFPRLSDSPLEL